MVDRSREPNEPGGNVRGRDVRILGHRGSPITQTHPGRPKPEPLPRPARRRRRASLRASRGSSPRSSSPSRLMTRRAIWTQPPPIRKPGRTSQGTARPRLPGSARRRWSLPVAGTLGRVRSRFNARKTQILRAPEIARSPRSRPRVIAAADDLDTAPYIRGETSQLPAKACGCSGAVSYALDGAGRLDYTMALRPARPIRRNRTRSLDHDLRQRRADLDGHRRPALGDRQRPRTCQRPAPQT
jgi:hypothetical protein